MFTSQTILQKTKQVINDAVKMNQTALMESSSADECVNDINFDGCVIGENSMVDINQSCKVVSSEEAYQKAVAEQISQNTLDQSLINQIKQTTQSVGLAINNQTSKTINDLQTNLLTEVQQQHLAKCYKNMSGVNKFQCHNSTFQGKLHIDQDIGLQSNLKCVQDSAQQSHATQSLKTAVSNSTEQTVQNSLWALAAVILAVGCALAVFMGAPVLAGGSSVAKVFNGPSALMLMSFCCLVCCVCTHAMNESNTYLVHWGSYLSLPPKLNESSWHSIWFALFIILSISTALSFYTISSHPSPSG
jgi:hypothetical protein